jgi:hypothetical protein
MVSIDFSAKTNRLSASFCPHRPKIMQTESNRQFPASYISTQIVKRQQPSLTEGADKSLARPTSSCILFHGENISFDASLVIYIYSTNIPPFMIINRIHETENLLSL